MRNLALILLSLTATVALAEAETPSSGRPCLKILSTQPARHPEFTPMQLLVAIAWYGQFNTRSEARGLHEWLFEQKLNPRGMTAAQLSTHQSRYLREQWLHWAKITPQQRNLALARELKGLEPKSEASVFSMDGRAHLNDLSRHNLNRYKHYLVSKLKVSREILNNQEITRRAAKIAKNLKFNYLRESEAISLPDEGEWSETEYIVAESTRSLSLDPRVAESVKIPFPSAFELKPLGLKDPFASIYSHLHPEASSVEFDILPTARKDLPLNLNHSLGRGYKVRLHDEFVKAHGFYLPTFTNVGAMALFFRLRNQEILRALPYRSLENMAQWTPENLARLFPQDQLHKLLAPLREELHRYILTAQDGEDLLTFALERFVLHEYSTLRALGDDIHWESKVKGGIQNIMRNKVMPILGRMRLHIPLAVSGADYEIIRTPAIVFQPLQKKLLEDPTAHPMSLRRHDP